MRWTAASTLLILAVLGFASPAAAAVVRLQSDAQGEVCRFGAGEGDDPFQRWLTPGEVTCVAAGSSLTFPPGRWNVFGRSDGAVSADPVLVSGAKAPESITLSLAPAATLHLQLPADHTGVVYAPKSVTAFPASENMTVPAAQELWLFVLAKAVPVAVIVIAPTDAGSERLVDVRNVRASQAVVGWLQVPEADRRALKVARGVNVPRIRITFAGKESAVASLPAPEALDGAFILLPGLSQGDLEFGGHGWLPVRRKIAPGSQALTIVRQPIEARATAILIVNWSTMSDLPALDAKLGTCQQPPPPQRFELTISSCASQKPGKPVDEATCQPIRTDTLLPEARFGSASIDDIAPGTYRAEVRFGKLPPAVLIAVLAPLDREPLRLLFDYNEAYGSLTRGGQPLGEDARIDFPHGVGFSPRDGSDYHAVLMGPVGIDEKIDIVPCRGQRAFVLTDAPFNGRGRLDIDIPDNILTVTVVDTFTHAALPSATLKFVLMSKRVPRRVVFTRVLNQDNPEQGMAEKGERVEGRFTIKGVPEREIRIHVTNTGYKTRDIDPFSITKTEKRDLEVQLEPLNGSQGKIDSRRSFEKGTILWFASAGVQTESADLSPDGTFIYEIPHLRDETMTVVSFSHPLWITRAPLAERGKMLEIPFPDAVPVRETDVWLAGFPNRAATLIGVVIGGLRVTTAALAQHLALRGLEPIVRGAGPLHVLDLAETGPIDFLRGPFVDMTMRTPLVGNFVPIATQRLGPGIGRVVFDGKP
jgi:hypothetical protein